MSLVTVSAKRNRVYHRKFDHDQARELYVMQDWPVAKLARHFGVSENAIKRVVDREFRRRFDEKTTAHIMGAKCVNCGGPRARYASRTGRNLCRKCDGLFRQTRFRLDETGEVVEVRCGRCRRWLPRSEFGKGQGHSREIRGDCRECGTRVRQNYRERHKVPCVGCGKPALPSSEKGRRGFSDPRCHDCYSLWRQTPEGRAAASEAARLGHQTRYDHEAVLKTRREKRRIDQPNLCPRGHERPLGRRTCDICRVEAALSRADAILAA